MENTSLFGATTLADHIIHSPPQPDFRFLTIRDYNGKEDPKEHVIRYKYAMMARGPNEATLCKGFSRMLVGAAMSWMLNLPAGSIESFAQLESSFLMHFGSSRKQKVTMQQVGETRQGPNESLEDYVKRFTALIVQLCDCKEDVVKHAFFNGLCKGKFKSFLYQKEEPTFEGMLRRANVEIQVQNFEKEEAHPTENSKKEGQKKDGWSSKRHSGNLEEEAFAGDSRAPGLKTQVHEENVSQIYAQNLMDRREESREYSRPKKSGKCCSFHHARSHDTKDCWARREDNPPRERSVYLANRKIGHHQNLRKANHPPPRYPNPPQ